MPGAARGPAGSRWIRDGSGPGLVPVCVGAMAVLLAAALSFAGDDEDGKYPYELLLAGKSAQKPVTWPVPGPATKPSPELAELYALDMELFPPSAGPAQCVETDPGGGGIAVHGLEAGEFDVLGSSFLFSPIPQPPESAVALLSGDLTWLEGLQMPDIPVKLDDRVVVYLDRFRSDPKWRKIIRSWMSRSERWGPQIREVLREQGLPEDLQYLAMIESGFNPNAESWAGAVGLWQFMPATGEEWGLAQTKWVDQRRNPELSTVAAARYLSSLHDQLGSWYLAMAAYNMGQGALLASIKKYNTNDFWKLSSYEAGLPWATSNYVPKIVAAAIVGRNRERFGMGDLAYEPTVAYDIVLVNKSCKLGLVAKAAGVTTAEIETLNPELRKARVPPDTLPYPVRVPDGKAKAFENAWPGVADQIEPLVSYTIKFGDTLARIAKECGSSVKEIADLNEIKKKDKLALGDELLVPAGKVEKAVEDAPQPVVGVPAVQFVYPDRRRVFYEIIQGDTLSVVAAFFQATLEDICAWNALDPAAVIHPGMWLQVWVQADRDLSNAVVMEQDKVRILVVGSDEFLDWQAGLEGKSRIKYTVKDGDTLKTVAADFGVKVSEIARINQFDYETTLQPGQEIVLYVKTESSENAGQPAP